MSELAERKELDPLFDYLEDLLVKGVPMPNGQVPIDDVMPILDASRALLMVWRGKQPLLPKGMPEDPS